MEGKGEGTRGQVQGLVRSRTGPWVLGVRGGEGPWQVPGHGMGCVREGPDLLEELVCAAGRKQSVEEEGWSPGSWSKGRLDNSAYASDRGETSHWNPMERRCLEDCALVGVVGVGASARRRRRRTGTTAQWAEGHSPRLQATLHWSPWLKKVEETGEINFKYLAFNPIVSVNSIDIVHLPFSHAEPLKSAVL